MPMKKRATHNIIVLKRGAHVLNSAFNHMKLIGELPPSLIQTSDNKQDSMKCSPNIMKVVIQLKDSPERQSHEAVKLSSPPQQHNSRPRNQLVDYRRHRYHRNLCYRLQATSPSSLFEIFLGDVRVMSFVARPISSMPAQILDSFLTVKPVCLTLTAHAVILHDPPVCIFNVVHVELRVVLLFFHLHTNQLSNLLCIFRCS